MTSDMAHLAYFLKTHPATTGIISSLGGVWISFLEVLPMYLRVINMGLATCIAILSLALKIREWRRKRRARIISPPDETQPKL